MTDAPAHWEDALCRMMTLFSRLNRPVPRQGTRGDFYGNASLDGAGGGGGLFDSRPRRIRGKYCYGQVVENDFA